MIESERVWIWMRFFVLLSVTDWPNDWYACAWGKREKREHLMMKREWWMKVNRTLPTSISFQNLFLTSVHIHAVFHPLISSVFPSFFLRIPSHQLFLLASTCLPFHFSLNFSLHFSFILVERCTNVRTDVWESVCMYVSMMFVCVWMGRCRPIDLFGKYVRKWDEIVVWLKGKKASKWVSEKESCTQGHPSVKPVLSTSFLNPFLSS